MRVLTVTITISICITISITITIYYYYDYLLLLLRTRGGRRRQRAGARLLQRRLVLVLEQDARGAEAGRRHARQAEPGAELDDDLRATRAARAARGSALRSAGRSLTSLDMLRRMV